MFHLLEQSQLGIILPGYDDLVLRYLGGHLMPATSHAASTKILKKCLSELHR
ncbi:hypothetical protein [Paraglaciecola sp.]|uniref:hypothetical protein n=1 Tax=Paraglaciecola sp. TaxID=1920173 RepID=UPI003EF2F127